MSHLIGRQLGRYLIEQEIGRGGMARVYRATDASLQRQVALKILAPQLSVDPEFARRFEREAVTAANLRHNAIVTIYDVGEEDHLRYIAMEYIQGRTLHAILEQYGALGLAYAVPLLDPIAEALDYAHSQGAVHRDVKPHNIMVDIDGRVLLADFGIVQAQEPEGERLTRTGIFMGTPEYMSPEQAEARRVDGRSDLYSLGIVAYELITGRVPFTGATPQLIVAHAQVPPPAPSSLAGHVPAELDRVLIKALAKHPRSRFGSATAMVSALRIVADHAGVMLAESEQIALLAEEVLPSQVATRVLAGRTPVSNAPPPALQPPPTGYRRPLPGELPRPWRRRPAAMLIGFLLLATLGFTFLLVFVRGNAAVPPFEPTVPVVVTEASATPVLPTPVPPGPAPVQPDPTTAPASPLPVPPTPLPPTPLPPTPLPPTPLPPTPLPPTPLPPTPTSTPAEEPPTSTPAEELPTSTPAEELPTSTPAEELPTSTPTAEGEPPTSTPTVEEEPATSTPTVEEEPATSTPTVEEEPALPTDTPDSPTPTAVLGTPIPLTPEPGSA